MTRGLVVLALIAGCVPRGRYTSAMEEVERLTVALAQQEDAHEAALAELEGRLAESQDQNAALLGTIGRLQDAAPRPVPNPNSEDERAAADLLKAASDAWKELDIETTRAKLEALRTGYPDSRAARAGKRLETETSLVGTAAAPLAVGSWVQGKADLGNGVTLLVFWEVWCPHCKREVPRLQALHEKYGAQGLQVVGITKMSRDITLAQTQAFLKEKGVTYAIAKERGTETSESYAVTGIPAAAVVKGGEVLWRGHPAYVTDAWIERWLDPDGAE